MTLYCSSIHNDNISIIKVESALNNNLKLFTEIEKKKKNFSLHFIDNNDPIMKLNKVLLSSQQTTIGYQVHMDENYFQMGLSKKRMDISLKARFKTRVFSSELEAYFGAPLVFNTSTAKINVETIFKSTKIYLVLLQL